MPAPWKPPFQPGDVVEVKGGASGMARGQRGTVVRCREVGRNKRPLMDVTVTRHSNGRKAVWTSSNLRLVPGEAADAR